MQNSDRRTCHSSKICPPHPSRLKGLETSLGWLILSVFSGSGGITTVLTCDERNAWQPWKLSACDKKLRKSSTLPQAQLTLTPQCRSSFTPQPCFLSYERQPLSSPDTQSLSLPRPQNPDLRTPQHCRDRPGSRDITSLPMPPLYPELQEFPCRLLITKLSPLKKDRYLLSSSASMDPQDGFG